MNKTIDFLFSLLTPATAFFNREPAASAPAPAPTVRLEPRPRWKFVEEPRPENCEPGHILRAENENLRIELNACRQERDHWRRKFQMSEAVDAALNEKVAWWHGEYRKELVRLRNLLAATEGWLAKAREGELELAQRVAEVSSVLVKSGETIRALREELATERAARQELIAGGSDA